MRLNPKPALAVLALCGLVPYASSAQQLPQSVNSSASSRTKKDSLRAHPPSAAPRTLTPDDGLAVLAAALDSRLHPDPEPDCSHLVHAIYRRAGFPYSYAPSSDLYAGTSEFRRVVHPQAGDLVVWQGHAGIVVNPAQHVFFSALRSGLGTDSYEAPYWKERGRLRFYRYIKGSYASIRR